MADSSTSIPIIVQGNSFNLAIPLQIYVIDDDEMVLEDYTPAVTDTISIQLKGSRRSYTYSPSVVEDNVVTVELSGNELADNYGVVVSIVKNDGQRLRSFRTDQFFIVESSDDLTTDDIVAGLEENVIYLNTQCFVAGKDGRGIVNILKTATVGLVDTYTIYYTDNTTSTYQVTNGSGGTGVVVNDLTTGGTTSALSAEMGKVLGEIVASSITAYSDSDLTKNYRYILNGGIGATVSENPSALNGWGCMRISVTTGDFITITTQGGSTARAWALTDTNRKILSVADSSSTLQSYTVTASQDGYLYVNCEDDAYTSFAVVRYASRFATEDYVDAEIAPIATDVANLKTGNFEVDDWDNTDLYNGGGTGAYWLISDNTYVSENPYTNNSGWRCIYPAIPVKAGDIFIISTKGGNNARAWALTDNNADASARTILSREDAGADLTQNPKKITVAQDGYLYVNCDASYSNSFFVKKDINVISSIENLEQQIENVEGGMYAPHFKDNPLPLWKDTLKVLAIGNSYTDDLTSYLKYGNSTNVGLVRASGIDEDKLCVYIAIQSSASLQTWVENYENDTQKTMSRIVGNIVMDVNEVSGDVSNITLKEMLSKDWDVVVLQQVSSQAGNYNSFNPYLTKLIGYIRENCTNQQVAIAWQSVWSHNLSTEELTQESWENICDATKEMASNDGIDIIIPTGTAIQNARAYQKLNPTFNAGNTGAVTRDDTHLEFGVGRYIAACTFFQTLLTPMFGASVLGNTAIHTVTTTEQSSQQNINGAVSVDNNNRVLCQLFAFYATINKWSITAVTSEVIADNVITPATTIYDRVATLESEVNIPVVEVSGATPSQTLSPNTFYKFTGSVTSLSVTLGTATSGIVNVYAFSFTAGAANPTITLPSGVELDTTPTIGSGDYVEFSILDNKAIAKVWQAQ